MTVLPKSVLIVEDDALIALSFADMLHEIGLRVCGTADTAERAIALAEELRPHLIMMDVRLRGSGDGIDAALAIQNKSPTAIIYVTGSCEQQVLDRMAGTRHAAVLVKPVYPAQLKEAVQAALTT